MHRTARTQARRTLDHGTLAAAYDAHGAAVFGLAQRVTGDDEVAARLTAEVFGGLRLVTADDLDDLRACVLTDVHRRAVTWTRANPSLRTRDSALPLEGFAQLPDAEQHVVAEVYFGARTYDEVAGTMGLDRSEVARLLHSALQRMGTATPLTPRLTTGPRTI